jgi:hypothetical protein
VWAAEVAALAVGAVALPAPQALASGRGQIPGALVLTPAISSFSPASGPAGTVVTVNGARFAGSGASCTGTIVTFHGIKAAACTFVSAAKPAPRPGHQLVKYAQPAAGAYAGASDHQKIFTCRHKPG